MERSLGARLRCIRRRHHGAACSALAILAGSMIAFYDVPARAQIISRSAVARATHTLSGTDTARMHLIHASGSELLEEGPVSGGVSGRARAIVNVGATFTGSFTFYLHGGTIAGHGSAVPHGSGRYESFAGTMVATHGTGRYAHVNGHGGMFGTFDRRTYAVVIETTGTLRY